MATATNSITAGPGYSLDYEYDNVTGEVQRLFCTITTPGTLTMLVHNPPKPDIVRSFTNSTSLNVPNNQYFLTQSPRGDWRWTGSISVETTWTPA